ncbi:MAG: hypothetical protein DWI24_01135 [Planctomycetota bacterium]|nr:MAG: hypothetical protein DWI24_01135 [Planctomycetota bacterium]
MIPAATFLISLAMVAAAPKTTHFYPSAVTRGVAPVVVAAEGDIGTDPKIWIDDSQLEFTATGKPGFFQVSAKPKCRPGWHVIRLYNQEGSTSPIALWVDDLPNFVENEPNNAPAEATVIGLHFKGGSAQVHGRLEKNGDVDGYRVHIPAGATLVARTEANRTLGSPMDSTLQIVDLKGFVLAHNDDSRGVDPELTWTARESMDVVVRLFAFPSEPNSTISFSGGSAYIYRLTLSNGPALDHLSAVAFQKTDQKPEVKGFNLVDSTIGRISDASGASGFGFLSVEGAEPLLVPRSIIPTLNADAPNADLNLKAPVLVGGTIETSGQRKPFQMVVKKGDNIQFRIFSKAWESLLDPVLKIRDEKGQVVLEQDDAADNGRDVDQLWAVSADGTYSIEITDLHRRSGLRYYYGMEVTREGLSPELNVSATNLILKAGEKAEIAVTYDKRADLESPIKIQVQGLPKGFPEVKPTEPAPAAPSDPAKKGTGRRRRGNPAAGQNAITIPIQLSADQVKAIGAWSGPVRIIATGSDGQSLPVRFNGMKGSKMGLDHVWLTILAAPETKPMPTKPMSK